MSLSQDNPSEDLVADQKIIESADGYVVVCGEYNRCIPRKFNEL